MFKLSLDPINLSLMGKKYSKLVNRENIISISLFKINRILKKESKNDKTEFIKFLLNKWVKDNPISNLSLLKKLKRAIKRYKLKHDELSKYHIRLFEERVFSIYRPIKAIDVDFALEKKEQIWAKFMKASLFEERNTKLNLLVSGIFYISNKRFILIDNHNEQWKYEWKEIEDYFYTDYGFKIVLKNKDTLVFRVHDPITVNNTIKNIISKKIKDVIKKDNK